MVGGVGGESFPTGAGVSVLGGQSDGDWSLGGYGGLVGWGVLGFVIGHQRGPWDIRKH